MISESSLLGVGQMAEAASPSVSRSGISSKIFRPASLSSWPSLSASAKRISVDGLTGVVQEIQARATLLKTSDGFPVVIPNSNIYTQKVTIYNSYDTRRTTVEFGIGFRDDLDEARRLIVEAVRGIDEVLTKPAPSAVCVGIGDNSVTVRARW
jgi:small-conductance mechanosensitive channel